MDHSPPPEKWYKNSTTSVLWSRLEPLKFLGVYQQLSAETMKPPANLSSLLGDLQSLMGKLVNRTESLIGVVHFKYCGGGVHFLEWKENIFWGGDYFFPYGTSPHFFLQPEGEKLTT